MLAAAARAGREIKAASRREMSGSVATMERRGLKVTHLTPAIEAEWLARAESTYPKIRGPIVPADIFDQVLRALADFRSGAGRPDQRPAP